MSDLHECYCGLATATLQYELGLKSNKALHVMDGKDKILEAAELAEQKADALKVTGAILLRTHCE